MEPYADFMVPAFSAVRIIPSHSAFGFTLGTEHLGKGPVVNMISPKIYRENLI
jgi:hypothetical protein